MKKLKYVLSGLLLVLLFLALLPAAELLTAEAAVSADGTAAQETGAVEQTAEPAPANVSDTVFVPDASLLGGYIPSTVDYEVYVPSGKLRTAAALPAFYDPRYAQGGYYTPVKDQGPFGTCWAFSVLAAAENSLLYRNNGEVTLDGAVYNSANLDLSELQTAYFYYHTPPDPLGNQAGDYSRLPDNSGTDYLQAGAGLIDTGFSLASWRGSCAETVLPYSEAAVDLAKDDSYAFANIAELQNFYIENMSQPNIIKQMIMEYGALAVSYYAGGNYYGITDSNQNKTCCYAYTGDAEDDHGVTLVGWDDNFAAADFKNAAVTADGAWLIKNSWGDFGEGLDGYVWISYQDTSLQDSDAVAVEMADAAMYDNNYQYDGSNNVTSVSYEADRVANVYQAQKNENLKAVSIAVASAAANGTIEIYQGGTLDNPQSGTLVTTQDFCTSYAGLYTFALEEPVALQTGDVFAVVFNFNEAMKLFVDESFSSERVEYCNNTENDYSYYGTENIAAAAGKTLRIKGCTCSTYQASVIVNKNDRAWTDASAPLITLQDEAGREYANGTAVENASYNILADGQDTGADIIVDGAAAQETLNYYTITFKDGQKTLDSQTLLSGSSVSYQGAAPVKEASAKYSCSFLGWAAASARQTVLEELPEVTSRAVYYAVFSKTVNKYTVTYELNYQDAVSPYLTQEDVAYGSLLTRPEAPVREGYDFDGWYQDAACLAAWTFSGAAADRVSGNTTLYAKWRSQNAEPDRYFEIVEISNSSWLFKINGCTLGFKNGRFIFSR